MDKVAVEKAFRDDLNALLLKYDAELELVDVGSYVEDRRLEVTIKATYDAAGNRTREFTQFYLGSSIYPK